MISESNFEKLELLEKDETEVQEQVYEEVAGFESLNSKVQTRTTAFSCKKEKEDYSENFLMSRPLPWVVRVFFKIEDSMKGILCSGKIRPNSEKVSFLSINCHLRGKLTGMITRVNSRFITFSLYT